MTDRTVKAARKDLTNVTRAVRILAEHLYLPERQGSEVKVRTSNAGSPALYDDQDDVRAIYLDLIDPLSKAHWILGRHTDVPAYWMRRPTDEWVAQQHDDPLPAWRAPTVPGREALMWTAVLDAMLAWCVESGADQGPVRLACEQIGAAAKVAGTILADGQRLEPEHLTCLHCDDRRVERGRKWCAGCRRAHGGRTDGTANPRADRRACRVCGLTVAS